MSTNLVKFFTLSLSLLLSGSCFARGGAVHIELLIDNNEFFKLRENIKKTPVSLKRKLVQVQDVLLNEKEFVPHMSFLDVKDESGVIKENYAQFIETVCKSLIPCNFYYSDKVAVYSKKESCLTEAKNFWCLKEQNSKNHILSNMAIDTKQKIEEFIHKFQDQDDFKILTPEQARMSLRNTTKKNRDWVSPLVSLNQAFPHVTISKKENDFTSNDFVDVGKQLQLEPSFLPVNGVKFTYNFEDNKTPDLCIQKDFDSSQYVSFQGRDSYRPLNNSNNSDLRIELNSFEDNYRNDRPQNLDSYRPLNNSNNSDLRIELNSFEDNYRNDRPQNLDSYRPLNNNNRDLRIELNSFEDSYRNDRPQNLSFYPSFNNNYNNNRDMRIELNSFEDNYRNDRPQNLDSYSPFNNNYNNNRDMRIELNSFEDNYRNDRPQNLDSYRPLNNNNRDMRIELNSFEDNYRNDRPQNLDSYSPFNNNYNNNRDMRIELNSFEDNYRNDRPQNLDSYSPFNNNYNNNRDMRIELNSFEDNYRNDRPQNLNSYPSFNNNNYNNKDMRIELNSFEDNYRNDRPQNLDSYPSFNNNNYNNTNRGLQLNINGPVNNLFSDRPRQDNADSLKRKYEGNDLSNTKRFRD